MTAMSVPSTVKPGKSAKVSIAVANQGNQAETFAVSLRASGGTVGAPRTITLNPGARATVTIAWRAPSVRRTYTLTCEAAVVSGETDTADNSRTVTISVR